MTSESKPSYKCQYCEKSFAKESTLAVHQCEPKRRAQQERETGVQWGYKAYLRFYEITQGSAKLKSYQDFANSQYYNAFVRFGRHMHAVHAFAIDKFTDWLLKNNVKLDHWTKDVYYEAFLYGYLRIENPRDAIERSIMTMQEWEAENNAPFYHYFLYASTNRIVHKIINGRISPWIIYNSKSGQEFVEKLANEPEQIELAWKYIDPDYWAKRFKDYPGDTEWAKMIAEQAGL